MIDFQEDDFAADDKQDYVSLKIVSSQEYLQAFSVASVKKSLHSSKSKI